MVKQTQNARTTATLSPEATIAQSLQNNQFISLQDTNHRSIAVKNGLTALIPALAKNNVKHLFIESNIAGTVESFVTYTQQEMMDDFLRGKISTSDVRDYFISHPKSIWTDPPAYAEAMVRLLQACKQHGIRVWASDPGTPILNQLAIEAQYPIANSNLFELAQSYAETGDTNRGCAVPEFHIEPSSNAAKAMATGVLPAIVAERIAINESVVKFAVSKAKSAQGAPEKAAFFWGAGHSNNTIGARDIDEFAAALDRLPGSKVANIAIYASHAAKACLLQNADRLGARLYAEPRGKDSDFLYFALEKEMTANARHSEIPVFQDMQGYQREQKRLFDKGLKL